MGVDDIDDLESFLQKTKYFRQPQLFETSVSRPIARLKSAGLLTWEFIFPKEGGVSSAVWLPDKKILFMPYSCFEVHKVVKSAREGAKLDLIVNVCGDGETEGC